MQFDEIRAEDELSVQEMAAFAAAIVKAHYDPIIGAAQNDYMIAAFQSAAAIREDIRQGCRYFFLTSDDGRRAGFIALKARPEDLYVSKFYLHQDFRGQGLSHLLCDFAAAMARKLGRGRLKLNVNRFNAQAIAAYEALGFRLDHAEKKDIGGGFVMDDYIYVKDLGREN